jgi:hypothetical protein
MSERNSICALVEKPASRGCKPVESLLGREFGRLIVQSYAGRVGKRQQVAWNCQGRCGRMCIVMSTKLKSGWTKSCGCYKVDKARADSTTHQLTHLPEHASWSAMIQRCENPAVEDYHRYGGRGIAVCERWRSSFVAFLQDMGQRPDIRMTIERKNVNGNYEPDNCIWATRKQQNRNRRSNRVLEWNGEALCVAEWAERLGIPAAAIINRLNDGWNVERALTAPLKKDRRREHRKAS